MSAMKIISRAVVDRRHVPSVIIARARARSVPTEGSGTNASTHAAHRPEHIAKNCATSAAVSALTIPRTASVPAKRRRERGTRFIIRSYGICSRRGQWSWRNRRTPSQLGGSPRQSRTSQRRDPPPHRHPKGPLPDTVCDSPGRAPCKVKKPLTGVCLWDLHWFCAHGLYG